MILSTAVNTSWPRYEQTQSNPATNHTHNSWVVRSVQWYLAHLKIHRNDSCSSKCDGSDFPEDSVGVFMSLTSAAAAAADGVNSGLNVACHGRLSRVDVKTIFSAADRRRCRTVGLWCRSTDQRGAGFFRFSSYHSTQSRCHLSSLWLIQGQTDPEFLRSPAGDSSFY